jgi:hypothetical protein
LCAAAERHTEAESPIVSEGLRGDKGRSAMARTDIFISYSHQNKKWLDQLRLHLTPSSSSQKLVI